MIRVQSVIESILYNLDEAYNRQHSNNELIDAINSVLRYVNLSLINVFSILTPPIFIPIPPKIPKKIARKTNPSRLMDFFVLLFPIKNLQYFIHVFYPSFPAYIKRIVIRYYIIKWKSIVVYKLCI